MKGNVTSKINFLIIKINLIDSKQDNFLIFLFKFIVIILIIKYMNYNTNCYY